MSAVLPRTLMAKGQLITIVGPSGAGKDAILALVKDAIPDLVFVQRVITRPADGGFEDHIPVSEDEFAAMSQAGRFALEWQANGLSYGIPSAALDPVKAGKTVIFNGSRGAMKDILAAFPDVLVLSVEVGREMLRDRLLSRGRETPEQIEARLDRDVPPFPNGARVAVIDNSGALKDAAAQMVSAITSVEDGGTDV
ncbi:MAG: phosphonate metabolism protein/1,5-bisphosphokinase (PRPP-forming) PhnN [Pseudomonadota bacterium]